MSLEKQQQKNTEQKTGWHVKVLLQAVLDSLDCDVLEQHKVFFSLIQQL